MQVQAKGQQLNWSIEFFCTNPWCMTLLIAYQNDVQYGPYPDELNLNGEGFYVRCRQCQKAMALHRSMLFAPFVESKEGVALESNETWRR